MLNGKNFFTVIDANDPENSIQNATIESAYYDLSHLKNSFKNSAKPILASLNVQSLLSKHANLSLFLQDMNLQNVPVDIFALQETWSIPHPELAIIPGYKFIHQDRKFARGGGVGFYIKDTLDFNICKNYSSFIPKIFECLSIEICLNGKKTIFSSIYRSPSSSHNELQAFLDHFDSHLFNLASNNITAYICLDSNINLLLATNHQSSYLSSISDNNFFQCIEKATRINKSSVSLIDHIITNANVSSIKSGVVISDISDHFITFIELPYQKSLKKHGVKHSRNFSKKNLENFRNDLRKFNWNNVTATRDIEEGYENFWEPFKTLYDLNFPVKKKKFNKNFHAKNGYMTKGLLISKKSLP